MGEHLSKVLLLIIDGLRPDAVTPERMPALHELFAGGWMPVRATSVRPSVTVAALTSLATGVSPARHGLVHPRLGSLGRIRGLAPLPGVLRRHGVTTTVVTPSLAGSARWIAGALLRLGGIGRLAADGTSPAEVLAGAAREIRRPEGPGFVVAYVNDTDIAGHAWGWMSPAYLQAARAIDRGLGPVAALLEDPDTLVIITADHGGGGVLPHDHDHPHPVNDAIPLCLVGPRVIPGAGGEATTARLLDIPPTVIWALGGRVPAQYEGRVLQEAFGPVAAVR